MNFQDIAALFVVYLVIGASIMSFSRTANTLCQRRVKDGYEPAYGMAVALIVLWPLALFSRTFR